MSARKKKLAPKPAPKGDETIDPQVILDRIEEAEEALDALWFLLQERSGLDLQSERDTVKDEIDALVAAAGIDR